MRNAIGLSLLLVFVAQLAMLGGASGAGAVAERVPADAGSMQHGIATTFPTAEAGFAMRRATAAG